MAYAVVDDPNPSCDSVGRIPIVLMSDGTGIIREVEARAAGSSNGLGVASRPARSERLKNHTEH